MTEGKDVTGGWMTATGREKSETGNGSRLPLVAGLTTLALAILGGWLWQKKIG